MTCALHEPRCAPCCPCDALRLVVAAAADAALHSDAAAAEDDVERLVAQPARRDGASRRRWSGSRRRPYRRRCAWLLVARLLQLVVEARAVALEGSCLLMAALPSPAAPSNSASLACTYAADIGSR